MIKHRSDQGRFGLRAEDVAAYGRDGYLLTEGLFRPHEVEIVLAAIETGQRVADHTHGRPDATGRIAGISMWADLGDDIWSAVATYPRMVNAVRILLGEEAAFYHQKVMLKSATTGGSWEWHQDYGYWYAGEQFVFPRMMSVFIAIDPATHSNGCLNVLRGSHQLGRLEHVDVGSQTAVDPERMRNLEPLFDRVECEMDPGDALFFHCNLVHSSGPNRSKQPRRSVIVAYNALTNPRLNPVTPLAETPIPDSFGDALLGFVQPAALQETDHE